ncbi:hypothetical protein Naga_101480g1 [Nannochloropsis gaditana]|uniref:Uncharacterized protein n=1 Tax=Nannochloropsis gaditana TaxID=72520 RepID=W7T9V8_9STRA|nr:hypothetical protein Naga_101480g1 [Nannochloropsis gaditana]
MGSRAALSLPRVILSISDYSRWVGDGSMSCADQFCKKGGGGEDCEAKNILATREVRFLMHDYIKNESRAGRVAGYPVKNDEVGDARVDSRVFGNGFWVLVEEVTLLLASCSS